jgi:hypothetical protein
MADIHKNYVFFGGNKVSVRELEIG